jgi:hypothetical protein
VQKSHFTLKHKAHKWARCGLLWHINDLTETAYLNAFVKQNEQLLFRLYLELNWQHNNSIRTVYGSISIWIQASPEFDATAPLLPIRYSFLNKRVEQQRNWRCQAQETLPRQGWNGKQATVRNTWPFSSDTTTFFSVWNPNILSSHSTFSS